MPSLQPTYTQTHCTAKCHHFNLRTHKYNALLSVITSTYGHTTQTHCTTGYLHMNLHTHKHTALLSTITSTYVYTNTLHCWVPSFQPTYTQHYWIPSLQPTYTQTQTRCTTGYPHSTYIHTYTLHYRVPSLHPTDTKPHCNTVSYADNWALVSTQLLLVYR